MSEQQSEIERLQYLKERRADSGSMNQVWVIEMWTDLGRWEACADAYLTQSDALKYGIHKWREKCPDDRFRATKYNAVSASEGHT